MMCQGTVPHGMLQQTVTRPTCVVLCSLLAVLCSFGKGLLIGLLVVLRGPEHRALGGVSVGGQIIALLQEEHGTIIVIQDEVNDA